VPGEDDDADGVKPLSPEERRKLFDLPEPPKSAPKPRPAAAPAAPRDHYLELDSAAVPGERPGKVISTIRVGGIVVDVVKLTLVGVAVGVIVLAAIRIVYRWHD
jgi:hypothetical protein